MKSIILLISLTFFSLTNIINAQSPDWLWAKGAGGASADEGKDICTDAAGNVYIVGFFNSPSITFGAVTLTSVGSGDIFIVKYDASGNLMWAKSAGGTSYDEGNSISTDASGNVYVGGYFQSSIIVFGADTLTNEGNMDAFIVKYNSMGNVVWAKGTGGVGNESVQSLHTDALGNILLTGYFQSPSIAFGNVILSNAGSKKGGVAPSLTDYQGSSGSSDVFTAVYDPSGKILWAKSAGGTSYDFGTGISNDANGNVYISGYFQSPEITFGNIVLKNAGGTANTSDIFLVKYDAAGTVVWAKNCGAASSEEANSISTDASGNSYITGYFQSPVIDFGITALTNSGSMDIYAAKYDAQGNAVWAKSASGASYDYGTGISIDANGNVYVTGYFQSPTITFGEVVLTNASKNTTSDIFIVKYDSKGAVVWAKNAGGDDDDESNSICNGPTGNIHLTGYFRSSKISFNGTTLTNAGSGDIFIAN